MNTINLTGLSEKSVAQKARFGSEAWGVCALYSHDECAYRTQADESSCLRGECNHRNEIMEDYFDGRLIIIDGEVRANPRNPRIGMIAKLDMISPESEALAIQRMREYHLAFEDLDADEVLEIADD